MVSPKRLAASILKCGKNRVWIDPDEINEISLANSRVLIRKLIEDGVVVKKPIKSHSRWHARTTGEAKMKGRHSGYGKRKGTREARLPSKTLWMRRIRVLRRSLQRYREMWKIDKHLYHEMYMKAKGNAFKHRRMLMESVHWIKAEKARQKVLFHQFAAKKNKICDKR